MKTYIYKAQSTDGSEVKGIVNAVDEYQAAVQVREQYPIIISIKEQPDRTSILTMDLNSDHIDIKSLSVACAQVAITLRSVPDWLTASSATARSFRRPSSKRSVPVRKPATSNSLSSPWQTTTTH